MKIEARVGIKASSSLSSSSSSSTIRPVGVPSLPLRIQQHKIKYPQKIHIYTWNTPFKSGSKKTKLSVICTDYEIFIQRLCSKLLTFTGSSIICRKSLCVSLFRCITCLFFCANALDYAVHGLCFRYSLRDKQKLEHSITVRICYSSMKIKMRMLLNFLCMKTNIQVACPRLVIGISTKKMKKTKWNHLGAFDEMKSHFRSYLLTSSSSSCSS